MSRTKFVHAQYRHNHCRPNYIVSNCQQQCSLFFKYFQSLIEFYGCETHRFGEPTVYPNQYKQIKKKETNHFKKETH